MATDIRRAPPAARPTQSARAAEAGPADETARAGHTPPARDAGETPLAHVATARNYAFRQRLLAHVGGAIAGTLPAVTGNVVAGVTVAALRHDDLQRALRESGIVGGCSMSATAAMSVLLAAAGHVVERVRGGANARDVRDRQMRTAVAAAALATGGSSLIDFGLGMAAKKITGQVGLEDAGAALAETALTGLLSTAFAASGLAAAYVSNKRIARVTDEMAAGSVQRLRALAGRVGLRDVEAEGVAPPAARELRTLPAAGSAAAAGAPAVSGAAPGA